MTYSTPDESKRSDMLVNLPDSIEWLKTSVEQEILDMEEAIEKMLEEKALPKKVTTKSA